MVATRQGQSHSCCSAQEVAQQKKRGQHSSGSKLAVAEMEDLVKEVVEAGQGQDMDPWHCDAPARETYEEEGEGHQGLQGLQDLFQQGPDMASFAALASG